MNRKTILIISSILGVIICCGAVAVWGIYSLLSNPKVKESINVAGEEMGAMLSLQQQIIKTYPCEDAGVQLTNGNSLNISLVNSEFNDLSQSQQSDKAREIAIFVKDNYTGNADITRIVINFVLSKKVGPMSTSNSFSYIFNVSDLE